MTHSCLTMKLSKTLGVFHSDKEKQFTCSRSHSKSQKGYNVQLVNHVDVIVDSSLTFKKQSF